MGVRKASHAGSWYTSDGNSLDRQLGGWVQQSGVKPLRNLRALICPHAGYSFSGPTAAYSYGHIDSTGIDRVFVLGPSHHVYLKGAALSKVSEIETPVGNMTIDQQIYAQLMETGEFEVMSQKVDEDEHSLEMQYPYIVHMMKGKEFTVVPVMVGATSHDTEAKYGAIFAPYFDDPRNLFVISSDFCHWGQRFDFMHYDKKCGEIYESIEALDKMGMELIEKQDTRGFYKYMAKYGNTICGCHPIGVFLNMLERSREKYDSRFVHYAQSSQVRDRRDSSVSYAACVVTSE
eukprot:GFYU01003480.1.p1 GENE.GFYU01003480.1~~GFYU01003480.1.p1  ORF type:complete len:335 (-),score=51.22 GFYU01003480.1:245-1114(-)